MGKDLVEETITIALNTEMEKLKDEDSSKK